jgi:hypothetical protein
MPWSAGQARQSLDWFPVTCRKDLACRVVPGHRAGGQHHQGREDGCLCAHVTVCDPPPHGAAIPKRAAS